MYFVCGASRKFNDTCLTGNCTFNMHHCFKLFKKLFSIDGSLYPLENSITSCFHRWNLSPQQFHRRKIYILIFPSVETSTSRGIQYFQKVFKRWNLNRIMFPSMEAYPPTYSKQKRCLKIQNMFPSMETYRSHVKLTKWFHQC